MAKGRLKRGHVLLKSSGNPAHPGLALTFPIDLAREHGLTAGLEFTCEITDEGILYRPVGPVARNDPRPAWMRS